MPISPPSNRSHATSGYPAGSATQQRRPADADADLRAREQYRVALHDAVNSFRAMQPLLQRLQATLPGAVQQLLADLPPVPAGAAQEADIMARSVSDSTIASDEDEGEDDEDWLPEPQAGAWDATESTMRGLRLTVAQDSILTLLRERAAVPVDPTAALDAAAALLPTLPNEWRLSERSPEYSGSEPATELQQARTEQQRVEYMLAADRPLRRGDRYGSVALNRLFAHAWTLIDEQPEPQRAKLHAMLVRNLAECIDEASDSMVCPDGIAQRIMEPLHQLLPGLFAVERTAKELVFETASVLRDRLAAAGEALSPAEVEAAIAAWENDCRTEAAQRFPKTMPCYDAAIEELEESLVVAREAL